MAQPQLTQPARPGLVLSPTAAYGEHAELAPLRCRAAEMAGLAWGRGTLKAAAAEASGSVFHTALRGGLCQPKACSHHCFRVETQELRNRGRKGERKNMALHRAGQDASRLAATAHAACPSPPNSTLLSHILCASTATSNVYLQTSFCPHCEDSSRKQLLNIQENQQRQAPSHGRLWMQQDGSCHIPTAMDTNHRVNTCPRGKSPVVTRQVSSLHFTQSQFGGEGGS